MITDAKKLWVDGGRPSVIRVRQRYYRLMRSVPVKEERRPLPVEERPVAARMILPKGVALRLHLTMLFAAQCQAGIDQRWRDLFPIEPNPNGFSWASLVAANATANPGILNADDATNKVRQLKEALKKLESLHLVALPRPSERDAIDKILLLDESGASTKAAPIPYRVPALEEPCIELPSEFFTRGWVHALTTSEIAALLMWFDLRTFRSMDSSSGHPVSFVPGSVRQGWYGLGRETYETHKPLAAFELMDVVRPEKRHYDGKWQGFNIDKSDLTCHRVTLFPERFDRDAIRVVEAVVRKHDAWGLWERPVGAKATELEWP
ncbi:hypothetical protein ACIRYZ_46445 [Kitasatospora sp. NPDC101155]|uniref:hypothetical protein n=1 Tax=Kitasatospora sp. NPDC101155 TaxID=3364097 RepID=UPI0037FBC25D